MQQNISNTVCGIFEHVKRWLLKVTALLLGDDDEVVDFVDDFEASCVKRKYILKNLFK